MVWVVDGNRRKRDFDNFLESLKSARLIGVEKLKMLRVPLIDNALLRDWEGSNVPVFFDFTDKSDTDDEQLLLLEESEISNSKRDILWCLLRVYKGMAYMGSLSV